MEVSVNCFAEKESVKTQEGEDCRLTGREALSYGEAARIVSEVCGRSVNYGPITETEMAQHAMQPVRVQSPAK